jgi:hypothetical protein
VADSDIYRLRIPMMDILHKLFEFGPLEIAWLFDCVLFFVGIVLGATLGPLIIKRISNVYGDLSAAVTSLESEVRTADMVVGKLWIMKCSPKPRPLAPKPIEAQNSDQLTQIVVEILNVKKRVQVLTDSISSVIQILEYQRIEIKREKDRDELSKRAPKSLNDSDWSTADTAVHTRFDCSGATSQFIRADNPAEIVEVYNRAVTDAFARERFREDYSPIRIGTVNAVERRQNPTLKAEIRATTDGNFFALPIPGTDKFAVFPRLGVTIEAVSYTAGAMGEVFEKTQKHDPKLFYSRYRVKQPAIFRVAGDRWELQEPGELDLGLGE